MTDIKKLDKERNPSDKKKGEEKAGLTIKTGNFIPGERNEVKRKGEGRSKRGNHVSTFSTSKQKRSLRCLEAPQTGCRGNPLQHAQLGNYVTRANDGVGWTGNSSQGKFFPRTGGVTANPPGSAENREGKRCTRTY